jgi:hypothetical protein
LWKWIWVGGVFVLIKDTCWKYLLQIYLVISEAVAIVIQRIRARV